MSILTEIKTSAGKHHSYAFRLFVKDHLTLIKNAATEVSISGEQQKRFSSNSAGLYNELGIPFQHYQVTDLINGISNHITLDEVDSILVPSVAQLNKYLQIANR